VGSVGSVGSRQGVLASVEPELVLIVAVGYQTRYCSDQCGYAAEKRA